MTDEGWQIMVGLEHHGFKLCGYNLTVGFTDVDQILATLSPDVVLVQDKREWDLAAKDFREPRARFTNVESLKDRHDIFKLTILKDAHQRPEYHMQSAEEMGVHAWVTYYHSDIVHHLAPYTRKEHLIRTYHSVNADRVPPYSPEGRSGTLLSGAVSSVYPMRQNMIREIHRLPATIVLRHPGYHRKGCMTYEFLHALSKFKVAICTSSMYGYALRKIIEATACGCIVVTDLPTDEVLPEIDDNLIRVAPTISGRDMGKLLSRLYETYDADRQYYFAQQCKSFYDYRNTCRILKDQILNLRRNYPC
jgi:hypothetical protein